MARTAFGSFTRRLSHRHSGIYTHSFRLDKIIHTPAHPASLLRNNRFRHGLHLYHWPRIVRLLGIPPGCHPYFLLLLFAQRRYGKCQLLVCPVRHTGDAYLRRPLILHILYGAHPRKKAIEDTLSPTKRLSSTSVADSRPLYSYSRRFHRIDHEFEQSIFQPGSADEPCRNQSGIQFHVLRYPSDQFRQAIPLHGSESGGRTICNDARQACHNHRQHPAIIEHPTSEYRLYHSRKFLHTPDGNFRRAAKCRCQHG